MSWRPRPGYRDVLDADSVGLVLTVIGAGLLFVVLRDKDSWA
ncbi:hypothetical protein ACQP0U_26750 [Micromonospora sp. CA-269861]